MVDLWPYSGKLIAHLAKFLLCILMSTEQDLESRVQGKV